MTTIYLMRHSEPMKKQLGIEDTNDSILLKNIKTPLSISGEKLAEKISKNEEFYDIDTIWSSNYVRTMSTAKYFAYRNNLQVNVSDKLGERIQGIKSWDEFPIDFEEHQFKDENYKIGFGESRKETTTRLLDCLNNLLNQYRNKKILIVGHSTAFAFLLSTWCEINYSDSYKFKNKEFFDGNWNYCETFKLEFDNNNNLINIDNIKFD